MKKTNEKSHKMQNGLGSTKKVYKHFESSTWLIYFFFAASRVRTNLQLCPKKKIKLKQTNSTHKHLMEASNEGKSHLMAMKKNRRKNLTCASKFCSESNWYKVGKSGNHSAWKVANVSSALIARNPTDSFICTKLI